MLKMAKAEKGMTAVQVDISKTFDTVSHEYIGLALKRKELPQPVVRLVEDSYDNIFTTIRNKISDEIEINIQRGIKQGDPLSLLIFNVIMEPLHALECVSRVFKLERKQISPYWRSLTT